MTKAQFRDCCTRMADLWPGTKRMADGTVDAWYEEFGSWAEYDTVLAMLARLVKAEDRRPTLAKLVGEYRTVAGTRPKHGGELAEEAEAARQRPHYAAVAKRWIRIILCMHDPGVKAMYHAMVENEVEPELIAEALLAEIDERGVVERDIERVAESGVGGLEPIGAVLQAAVAG